MFIILFLFRLHCAFCWAESFGSGVFVCFLELLFLPGLGWLVCLLVGWSGGLPHPRHHQLQLAGRFKLRGGSGSCGGLGLI